MWFLLKYLVSCIKLFLNSPDEMKSALGSVFQSFTSKEEDIDLRDRAAFFYRAMQDDIESFKNAMIKGHIRSIDKFCEEKEEAEE